VSLVRPWVFALMMPPLSFISSKTHRPLGLFAPLLTPWSKVLGTMRPLAMPHKPGRLKQECGWRISFFPQKKMSLITLTFPEESGSVPAPLFLNRHGFPFNEGHFPWSPSVLFSSQSSHELARPFSSTKFKSLGSEAGLIISIPCISPRTFESESVGMRSLF